VKEAMVAFGFSSASSSHLPADFDALSRSATAEQFFERTDVFNDSKQVSLISFRSLGSSGSLGRTNCF
jgi:hypothetical protein